jgi:hypothetical protein
MRQCKFVTRDTGSQTEPRFHCRPSPDGHPHLLDVRGLKVWRDQNKPAQAHDLLAPIYDWLNEGFDNADLKAVKSRPTVTPPKSALSH